MLDQVLEVFKNEYEKKGKGIIMDTYKYYQVWASVRE